MESDRDEPPAAPQSEREPAPLVELPDLDGNTVRLADFRGQPALVLFWRPSCGYCRRMLDDLKAWEAEPPAEAPRLLIVSTGSVEENRAQGLHSPVVLDSNFATGRAFGATGTPSAVLVDADGTIASAVVIGATNVLALANGREPAPPAPLKVALPAPPTLRIGEPAPPIRLPTISGDTVDLADFRGSDTLVLFWNPGCGYCAQMLDRLRAWEETPPPQAPNLLVVSTGSAEAHAEMGLRAPIALDEGFQTGQAFGARGTPTAVLVDREGKVASEPAAGGKAVLALAGYDPEVYCNRCLAECEGRGGGQACRSVCQITGHCP
jgi:peroxiredoxin